MPAVHGDSVSTAAMCGHCCEGRGGIVVSPADLTRLAAHMQQPPQQVAEGYCERIGGKLKIRCGDDGYCIFFIRAAAAAYTRANRPSAGPGLFFAAISKTRRALPWPKNFAPVSNLTPHMRNLRVRGANTCVKTACLLPMLPAKPTLLSSSSHATSPFPPNLA